MAVEAGAVVAAAAPRVVVVAVYRLSDCWLDCCLSPGNGVWVGMAEAGQIWLTGNKFGINVFFLIVVLSIGGENNAMKNLD